MSSAAVETSLLKAAESGIAPKSEAPKRRLGLVVALALGSFALGATVATAAKSGARKAEATNLSGKYGLSVNDMVVLQNLNMAPHLNGQTAIVKELGPPLKVMIDGGKVINVHPSKADPCTIRDPKYGGVTDYKCVGMKEPSPGPGAAAVSKPVVTKPAGHPLDKKAWTHPICAEGMLQRDGQLMFDITRTKICSGWCGVMSTATQPKCIGGDVVKQKRDACCAGFPPCNRAGLPKCKW